VASKSVCFQQLNRIICDDQSAIDVDMAFLLQISYANGNKFEILMKIPK
jgi:hypothetical protein